MYFILIRISSISLQGKMEQSLEFRQAVIDSPLAEECESQMNQGNNLLSACRNATEIANRLDQLNVTLNYSNIPTSFLRKVYSAYSAIRHLLYPFHSENILPLNSPQNEVQISVQLNKNSSALNVTVKAPIMDINFTNVRLSPLAASLLQLNPANTALHRIAKQISPLLSQRKFILSSRYIFSILVKKITVILISLQGVYRIYAFIIFQKR
jgi:hypothetical protein